MSDKKRVAFHTLGCKLNFSETSSIARLFGNNGFERVDFNEKADIYVINTCSVTEIANKKCRQSVKKAIKTSPDAFIAVIGCYAQLKPAEISNIPGVDLVLGANEKFNVINYLNSLDKKKFPEIHSCEVNTVHDFVPSYSSGDRTRSFLKIQDGCDYPCTYCTIPLARGKSRNNSIIKTIEEAHKIASEGFKEIILTGVNIGDFGKSTNETFLNLIQELDKVKGIERFRISSIEPNLLTTDIIEFVAKSNKFVPHFHIPLQSGSNYILGLMKRRYKTNLYSQRVNQIKKILPNASIGVDVIVGFPGESQKDFINTYNYLNNLNISYLHVFSYSERPNTKSIDIQPKVSIEDINKRSKMLQILSDKKQRFFYEKNIGNETNVLFEGKKAENKMYGFTENYIKIETKFNQHLINTVQKVKLSGISKHGNMLLSKFIEA
ncbi:MAG: tRNA (N(6)-L-threonylcarbamoyladenosine(37)-C(2))-methylthiotransferase MtaB [Chlorobi bacterium]|nr:tRNA (N(6)-L-threonylcarbamoyladenosine(37)-C(2))-methylthiotransferase MtaB [Chlorobiota bacterium]